MNRLGPFPAGLTGKAAFVTLGQNSSTVHLVDVASSSSRSVSTESGEVVEGLTWAPGGQHLVMQTFTLRPSGPNGENRSIRQLKILNADGTFGPVIFDRAGPEYQPAYSRDGRLAYFGGWSTDPDHGVFIDGAPVLDVGLITSNSDLSWLPDGSGLLYTEQASGIWRLNLADKQVSQVVQGADGVVAVSPAVSPDGARIAVSRYGGASGDGEIWTYGINGMDPKRLTTGYADDHPQWTPGGRFLAFSRLGGGGGVYLIDPRGGTPVRIIAVAGFGASRLAWTH